MLLGLDPGVTGAVAFYDPMDDWLSVEDVPTHSITQGGRQRSVLDYYGLARLVSRHALAIELAVIEQVNAMPGSGRRKMGATSAFRFGEAFGAVQMVVAAAQVPMELVQPSAWKRVMRLTNDKDGARRRASQLLPAYADQWSRARDHDRAEATLLALYGARLLQARQT